MKLAVLKTLLCTLGIFLVYTTGSAQIGLGEIVITGYNSDAHPTNANVDDEFSIAILTDISGTNTISITDNGWFEVGGFRSGEGRIVLTITNSYACGAEIRFVKNGSGAWSAFDETGSSAGTISASGDFALSSSGDQIMIYNGSTAPTAGDQSAFITALHFAGASWDADATGSVESAQPSIFTNNPGNDFAVTHMDNGKYGCSLTAGLPSDLRAGVYNAGNWSFDNDAADRFNLANFCDFSCTAACNDPMITSLTTNSTIGSNTFCPGDNVIITITGMANDATSWNLYAGNTCGGTALQTIPVNQNTFSVTASSTTTYSIAGTGGCVATPTACTPIIISVNGLTANAGADQKISSSTTANISGNGSGTWSIIAVGDGNGYFDGVPGTTTSSTASTTFGGTAGQAYTLRWTVTNAGCPSSSDDVVITFLNPTTLGLGDIAFIAYSADEDDLAFVILKDINAGTTITFTDRGWQSAGGFAGNEGTITVEFCRPYACGTEFNIFDATQEIKDASGQIAGDITGVQLDPSTSGDQIFAYQGTEPTVGNESNFLAAIQMNGPWDADATNTNTSAQPAAFIDGVNSLSFASQVQNAYLDCSKVTSASATQINDASNWITSNSTSASLPLNCNLTCCTPAQASSISGGSGGPFCPGTDLTLQVSGQLNDDQTWEWYTGSCGGTPAGTGLFINISPTTTTTYYVRGEGTCSGTSGSCGTFFTVVIDDTVAPTANCPATINVNNDPGLCSAVVSFSASATDNCDSNVDITYSQNPGTIFNVGTTSVTATATDDTGNQASCSFDVVVTDNEGPTGTCHDMSLDLAANGQVNFNVFAAGGLTNRNDNCGLSSSVGVTGPTLFTCDDVGSRSVTIFNRDINGNETPCTVTLTINDPLGVCNQPPVANCKNISVSADLDQCETTITPAQVNDGSSDPDGDPLTLSLDNSGPFTVGGPYTVELTVSDGSLTDKCTAMVTVTDDQAPTLSNCPGNISVSNDAGDCGADVNWTEPSISDNCPGATSSSTHNSGEFFPVGSTVVTYSGVDAAANDAVDCSFTVTVNDTEAPTFSNCPGNISMSNDAGDCGAVVSWTPPTLGDNCPGATSSSTHSPGNFFPVGSTTVIYSGVDAAGNTATDCSFTVTVNDTEAPDAICQNFTVGLDATGSASITVSDIDNGSTDACG